MRKSVIISLILLALVICSPFYLPVCSVEANGDANTPTFELSLEPMHPQAWLGWRPEYKTNASFVATLKDTTSTDQPYGLSYSIVNGQFRLLWSGGGGTVTGFEYQYRENGGSWSSWLSAGSGTFIDLLNLVNGTTYQFQVRAMNGTLVIAISDTFEVRVPTVPDAPTITRVDSGDGQVNINWTAPSNNGGSDITDYEYQYRESNGGTWEAWTSFGDRFTSTSEDIAGLTNGTAYEFRCALSIAWGECFTAKRLPTVGINAKISDDVLLKDESLTMAN